MDNSTKFVDFSFCKSCKHFETDQADEPCNSCLEVGAREGTCKPLNYKPSKEKKNGRA